MLNSHLSVEPQVRCVDGSGHETWYVKGSVEAVLQQCVSFETQQKVSAATAEMREAERSRVLDAAGALGSKGRRYVRFSSSCRARCRSALSQHAEDSAVWQRPVVAHSPEKRRREKIQHGETDVARRCVVAVLAAQGNLVGPDAFVS